MPAALSLYGIFIRKTKQIRRSGMATFNYKYDEKDNNSHRRLLVVWEEYHGQRPGKQNRLRLCGHGSHVSCSYVFCITARAFQRRRQH